MQYNSGDTLYEEVFIYCEKTYDNLDECFLAHAVSDQDLEYMFKEDMEDAGLGSELESLPPTKRSQLFISWLDENCSQEVFVRIEDNNVIMTEDHYDILQNGYYEMVPLFKPDFEDKEY